MDTPEDPPLADDSHLPLAVRRKRRQIKRPKRFPDDLPEAPASLPLPSAPAPDAGINEMEQSIHSGPLFKSRKILRSPRNPFGLFRQYFAIDFPSHDPDSELSIDDLSDLTTVSDGTGLLSADASPASGKYGPYPNASSFSLGEWFWNNGLQKSKDDFKHLVGIITDPAFRTEDIRDTPWDRIDRELGDSGPESNWIEEPDAGWTRTPVTIRVPFPYKINKRGQNHPDPIAPQDFVVEEFYHRSIVTILKERLNSADARHFHMEPYELYWQPGHIPEAIRVQGEIYTSPAFIDAHNALQESSGEPGCDLPRVVVALMFASDATQLTSFGQARVWPLYLNFGNDSKYRRSKPSLHLCNHVAYFKKVCLL